MNPKRLDADRLGAIASGVCFVHCVITGVALGLVSALGMGFFASPWLDYGFIGLALVVGIWAAISGYRRHHDGRPAILFALGIGLMIASHREFDADHQHGGPMALVSALGGLCFVGFHVWNLRLRKSCAVSSAG